MELKRYFVEIAVNATTWVQVYAQDSYTAGGLADAVASNLDRQFIDQIGSQIVDGDYTCEPYETIEAASTDEFVKGILTIKQVHQDTCQECGRDAVECSFGGYEVVDAE